MPQTRTTYLMPGMLTVTIVIAVSAVTAIAITAWLVHQVARRAIDKTTPEGVAPVILALGALLNPLRLFLPWSSLSASPQPQTHANDEARSTEASMHTEISPDAPQEARHEKER